MKLARGAVHVRGVRTAVRYFDEAIAIQPDYARAYAALGQMQLEFLQVGPLSPNEIFPKAEAATWKALELDPNLPLAHRMLGNILRDFYWRWEEGDDQNRLAYKLEHTVLPRGWMPLHSLLRTGRADEAVVEAERLRTQNSLEVNALFGAAACERRVSGASNRGTSARVGYISSGGRARFNSVRPGHNGTAGREAFPSSNALKSPIRAAEVQGMPEMLRIRGRRPAWDRPSVRRSAFEFTRMWEYPVQDRRIRSSLSGDDEANRTASQIPIGHGDIAGMQTLCGRLPASHSGEQSHQEMRVTCWLEALSNAFLN